MLGSESKYVGTFAKLLRHCLIRQIPLATMRMGLILGVYHPTHCPAIHIYWKDEEPMEDKNKHD